MNHPNKSIVKRKQITSETIKSNENAISSHL
jgi:hypothetical protein